MSDIYVNDFLSANGGIDESLRKAISLLHDGDSLHFEEQEYRLHEPLVFKGLSDITIDGHGASFINLNYNPSTLEKQNLSFFHFIDCHNLTVGNFSLDYDKPLNITGTIANVGSDFIDVALIGEDRYVSGKEYLMTVNSFSEDLTIDDELAHSTQEYYRIEKIDGGTLRIFCPPMGAKVGRKFYGSFKMNATPAVDCERSGNVLFHDIRVYSSCHFLFYISPSSGSYSFSRVVGEVHEGSERLIALNADAIHVAGITGSLSLTDCTFVGLGDDALNVHTCSARCLGKEEKTVKVEEAYFHTPLSPSWGEAGHILGIYDSKTYKSKGEVRLEKNDGSLFLIDGDSKLIEKGDYLVNLSVLPSVNIRRCHFERGRARGILLRTHDVVVEDSYLGHFALPGILIAADLERWFEMIPSCRVMIKDNIIERTAIASLPHNVGAIAIKLTDDKLIEGYCSGIFNDIAIVGNKISGYSGDGIYAQCVKGLLIKDNNFSNGNMPSCGLEQYAIAVCNSENVTIKDNNCPDGSISLVGVKNV